MYLRTKYDVTAKLESFYDGGPVAVSSNGELVACVHNGGIKVVSALTSKVLLTLLGDSETLTAVSFGGDSSVLFGASRSLQLLCWSMATGKCMKFWKGHSSAVAHMAVDPTGGLLATGGADRTARVWDVTGYYCTHVFRGHRAPVQQVLFQTKDLALVTASEDGEIRVWDLVSRTCTATLAWSAAAGHKTKVVQAHLAAVTSLSLSPDGWTLLSAGRDKVAAIWDLRAHKALRTIPVFEAVEGAVIMHLDNCPERPQPAASGQKKSFCFATGGESGVVKIWDSARGRCIASCNVDGGAEDCSQIASLSCSSGGTLMATTADGRILFFSLQAAGKGSVDIQKEREMVGDLGEVTDVRFLGPSHSPTHIAVATNSPAIRIFSISHSSCQAVLYGHTDIVLALDAKCDGNGNARLASGGKDAFLRLWKIEVTPLQLDQATPVSVTSTCLGSIKAHTSTVTAVLLGQKPTSNFVLSASSDKMLKVWEAATDGNRVMQSLAGIAAHTKDINSLSLSPDESLVCTTSQDRTAKIWRLPALVLLLTLHGHRKGVWAAGFSPVEQTIATASADKTVKLWALKEGSCLRTLEGHTASVLRLLHINSGKQIVTSGADGLVKLWSIRSSECVATFDEHGDRVWALHGGGESDSLLVSGGSDATICIWRDVTRTVQQETATAKTAAVAAQQALANAVQAGDLQKAASLAFMGSQPKQLQVAIENMQHASPDDAREVLKGLVSNFTPDQLKQALCLLRDWNTQMQFSPQAQALLQTIFLCHSSKIFERILGLEEILASLAPYTERHIAHVDRLLISSNVLDYTLNRMHNVDPVLQ